MQNASGSARGFGCLVLFSLPFAAGGVFGLVMAYRELTSDASDPRKGIMLVCFGLTFLGAAAGLITAGLYGARKQQRVSELRAAHPNEPWMWREEWRTRRVLDAGRTSAIGLWVFTLFWNAVSFPILLLFPEEWAKGNKGVLVGLLFPAVGLILLIVAIRSTLRVRKFRTSHFAMNTFPGSIGGRVAGQIETSMTREQLGGAEVLVSLSCIERRVSGSGKSRSTHETVLWQEEDRLGPGSLAAGLSGAMLPVSFAIPAGLPAASVEPVNPSIHWRLCAEAAVPGIDYTATFEIPVFDRGESAVAPLDAPRSASPISSLPPFVTTTHGAGGATEMTIDPPRPTGALVPLVLFLAVWNLALIAMLYFHAPKVFVFFTALFDILLLLGVTNMLFSRTKVTVDDTWIGVESAGPFGGSKKRMLRSDVTAIEPKIAMSGGQNGARQTVWYAVEVRGANKKLVAARNIRDKRHATAIADRLRSASGIGERKA